MFWGDLFPKSEDARHLGFLAETKYAEGLEVGRAFAEAEHAGDVVAALSES